jgi:hypothetical protein
MSIRLHGVTPENIEIFIDSGCSEKYLDRSNKEMEKKFYNELNDLCCLAYIIRVMKWPGVYGTQGRNENSTRSFGPENRKERAC